MLRSRPIPAPAAAAVRRFLSPRPGHPCAPTAAAAAASMFIPFLPMSKYSSTPAVPGAPTMNTAGARTTGRARRATTAADNSMRAYLLSQVGSDGGGIGQLLAVPPRVRFFSNMKYEPPAEESAPTGGKGGEEKKPGKWQQLKIAFKEYRYVFLAYYGTTFLVPIPFLWAGLEIGGLDGVGLLQWLGADKLYEGVNEWNNSFINLLVALEMNELLEFVRLPLILSTTPKVAHWWRSRGSTSQSLEEHSKDEEEGKN
jgi:hypothetical protein